MWPFLAWSAIAAYIDFWNRTGRRREIAELSPGHVIVPTHDYHTGTRILSISALRPHQDLADVTHTIRSNFLDPIEAQYAPLHGVVRPELTLAALLEVVGEEEGLRMLREMLAEHGERLTERVRADLPAYIAEVAARGFTPMRLHFAIQRYHRWAVLSPDATPQARVRALQEFYDTYALHDLAAPYPETRARFFRQTVFAGAPGPLAEGLDELVARLRRRELDGEALIDAIADLRARIEIGPDEEYFLARLSYPHLRPEDSAGFVQADLGGRHQSEMVVTLEDQDGSPFLVRHALNPKEVGRLHRLFLEARLDVRFRPEHHYLVALSDRGQIVGGIYYEPDEAGRTAHLEKIVVAEPFRRKGVADGLMKEFFNRLWDAGFITVTTGFFRPEYFYAYGFAIEKRYAGLVKSLLPPDARSV